MAAQSVEKDVDALREDLAALKTDVSSLVDSLKEIAANEGSAAAEKLKASAERTKEKAHDAAAAAARKIEERPLSSVLIAFGIGLLIGIILDRRS